jgi:hypothetical protein
MILHSDVARSIKTKACLYNNRLENGQAQACQQQGQIVKLSPQPHSFFTLGL